MDSHSSPIELCPYTSLKVEYLQKKYLEFSSYEIWFFPPFTYLLNNLYQYGIMGIFCLHCYSQPFLQEAPGIFTGERH